MRHALFLIVPTTLVALACGGGAPPLTESTAAAPEAAEAPAAAPQHGSVAFQTYVFNGHYMKFRDSKVDRTWDNMVGPGLKGTYTQVGDTITAVFEPSTSSTVNELRFRQLDDCSIANYYWSAIGDPPNEDKADVYRRVEPRCPHR